MSAADRTDATFSPRTVAILLALGVAGFVAMMLLGTFAPDLRSGRNGGAHALSNAATGFSGIVALAEATGRHPRVVRAKPDLATDDLLVLTPEQGATDLTGILAQRTARPTLLILPKWLTAADPRRRGWVRAIGPVPRFQPQQVLSPRFTLPIARRRGGGVLRVAPGLPRDLRFVAPPARQGIALRDGAAVDRAAGANGPTRLHALIGDRRGIVLARLGAGPLYVLADPDLLANQGLRDPRQARAALGLLDWLNSTGAEGIAFDVTLNGFGATRSPLKLAFEPPFLAMTLALAITVLLVAWAAAVRFGAPVPAPRAIAFGKAALVDNAASLVRKARREARLGGRYADMIRDRAVIAFGVPARLREDAIDAYLDRARPPARFTTLAAAAARAQDETGMLAAARALHDWLGETER
ncbi:MAG: DUF4350 domain-containing protein [Sphingomonas sp.]